MFFEIDSKMKISKGKLLFFGQLKQKFGYEEYLNLPNVANRKAITQLRLSAHKLEIEIGRYKVKGKNTDKKDRICQYCRSGEVESELHFIASCPNYKEERVNFYSDLVQRDEIYANLSWSRILDMMFTKNDLGALNLLGSFLRKCWGKRELMVSNFAC